MQVEDDLGDLDDTQVAEPGRKRWKEDHVTKDTLTHCAEDAAGGTIAELKAISPAARCRGTRPEACRKGRSLGGKTNRIGKRSFRLDGQQNKPILNKGCKIDGKHLRKMDGQCNLTTKRL